MGNNGTPLPNPFQTKSVVLCNIICYETAIVITKFVITNQRHCDSKRTMHILNEYSIRISNRIIFKSRHTLLAVFTLKIKIQIKRYSVVFCINTIFMVEWYSVGMLQTCVIVTNIRTILNLEWLVSPIIVTNKAQF